MPSTQESDTFDSPARPIVQIQNTISKDDGLPDAESGDPKYDDSKYCVYTHPRNNTKQMMPQSWSVTTFSNNILGYLENQNVMRWLNIGKSGVGKTTLVCRILHDIVCTRNKLNFKINWYSGKDIVNIPKIVNGLKKDISNKGRNHVLVFDDSSYTLESASNTQIADLANILTTIRHELGENSKFLIIFNVHSSKALLKRLREAELVTTLSVTQNDRIYLAQELFSENALRGFTRMYRSQSLKGFFSVNLESWTKKKLIFNADKVHIGLQNLLGRSSYFVFDKLDCPRCNKSPYYNQDEEKYITPKEILNRINITYPQTQYAKVLRHFAFFNSGDYMMLNVAERKVMKLLMRIMMKSNVDTTDLVNEMNTNYLLRRKNHKWASEREIKNTNEVMDLIQLRRQEREPMERHDLEDK